MSDSTESATGGVDKILQLAQYAGASVVGPMVKSYLRDQTVSVLNTHDPEMLQQYILIDYDLAENKLPDYASQALQRLGPKYSDRIEETLTPDNVMDWMSNPDEHLDVDEETANQLEECAEIIESTPGGRAWLENQILYLWRLCGIV